jgi:antibiotic biosynthesis monooxygenase (ABM) superfamily enzyme
VHALKNLFPIIAVVVFFQLVILQQMPENTLAMAIGLLIVAVGVALFLQGLELSIFPVGKSLSNQFARKGSVPVLLSFGFAMGFSAVVAEPALIAVAQQAEEVSEGKIKALTLRILVAVSVGLVVALGVFRTIFGYPLHWFMIIGYIVVVIITWFAPPEIVGLAYDSGGVTTNIVTVPLIAALGIGLAASIRGRNPLLHGFGLVALAVMVPMITVQLYGIVVYSGDTADPTVLPTLTQNGTADQTPVLLGMLLDLAGMVRDVLPIIITILFFQYLVLRRGLTNPRKILFGFALVVLGLYAFVVGLKLGLFPIGTSMARQLMSMEGFVFVYLFAFMIGFATTMAEPALIAIGHQAEQAAAGTINGNAIRIIVAIGVAVGITLGVHRIISGDSIHHYIIGGYILVIILTALAPRCIIPLAYDLGGVTTSEVTVPLVTALGIGLASSIEGRNVLIDGFGLIAFASIFPIVTVMSYAIVVEMLAKQRKTDS